MKIAKLLILLSLSLALSGVTYADPMGTAFTYQGHLYDSNSVADGLYDFQFRLYDANVDFEDFARFANYWLETGAALPADLNKDENNIVGYYDLAIFVDEWLYYCPYDWPLK